MTSAPTSAPVIGPTTAAPTTAAPITVAPSIVASDAPSLAPSGAPVVLSPTPTPVQTVRITDYYISFVAPDATREPTQDEYDEMLRRITEYYKEIFTGIFATDPDTVFLDIISSNDFTLFGDAAGIPEARFNIYMNFDFSDIIYTEESVVPTNQEIFTIMEEAITQDFILEVVRTYTGTPFESTNEVFFAASEFVGPP